MAKTTDRVRIVTAGEVIELAGHTFQITPFDIYLHNDPPFSFMLSLVHPSGNAFVDSTLIEMGQEEIRVQNIVMNDLPAWHKQYKESSTWRMPSLKLPND